ncbi:Peptide chain release factor 1 [Yarrowia sp. C11]|nr:Peptide chain release factor 1 [Yarrowia sp. C11]KAG5370551.1 Peptide chain release factor 1 [Yarrowia sp. E02]
MLRKAITAPWRAPRAVRMFHSTSTSSARKLHPILLGKAESMNKEYEALQASPNEDQFKDKKLIAKINLLGQVTHELDSYKSSMGQYEELVSMCDDPELKKDAEDEIPSVEAEAETAIKKLESLLLPTHPYGDIGCIIEMRPGIGGEEACLFTDDLLNMYTGYADEMGWPYQITTMSRNDKGGITEVILSVDGEGSYNMLQHEGGVHRVQRVPATESSGRVHTSAAAVIVLPQISETSVAAEDIQFAAGEVRIDVMRAQGAGGQHVNKTESAVRLVHLPTKTMVVMQNSRSQRQNKETAFMILRGRLAEQKRREQAAKSKNARTSQVSATDRSDKIRTYNFHQNRVTDHRCGYSGNLDVVMSGKKLDDVLEALEDHYRELSIKDLEVEE